MLVYGRNVAKELLENNSKINKIYIQEGFNDQNIITMLENSKIEYIIVSKREIDRLAPGVNQGIILDIPNYSYKSLENVLSKKPNFIVLLDHIEDPHNLGAIIRTCEAAGVNAIIIPKDRQVQVNATVMKTSVGTINNVDIVQVTNISNTIRELKKKGFWIVGTALNNSVDYRSVDYDMKTCLIIGNEGSGMSNLVQKNCDYLVKIPMYGVTNSLNASVAAGIMIYEVIRNRK